MNRFIYKSAGDVSHFPQSPVISRFVSPWDTSGWYSVLPEFALGKRVYSNSAAEVVSCPEKYFGADYIMTFNSAAEGFDDRQEVDFFTERDSVVSVCLDASAPLPEWAADYADAKDAVTLSNGASYRIFEKNFRGGSCVHIPGLSGDGNHFFVLARPVCSEGARKELPKFPAFDAAAKKYESRTYKSYVCETFNKNDALDGFEISETARIARSEGDCRDGYVKISGKGYIEKKIDGAGERLVCSASVIPEDVGGVYGVCVMLDENGENICGVFIDNGEIKAVTSSVAEKLADVLYGEEYTVKVVYDGACGKCEVWINSRVAARGVPANGNVCSVGFYSTDGCLCIDDLKVYDDTEVFVCDENGDTLCAEKFVFSGDVKAARAPIPFERRPSLELSSKTDATATYMAPEICGVGSYEVKVKASDEGMLKLSLISDQGEAGAVALYKNSLYVADADEWKQVFAGLTDWCYYPSGNWFYIKITFNAALRTYDVWVDGACRAERMKMTGGAAVRGLGFAFEVGTTVYIEKIRAYDSTDLCRGVIPNAPVFDVRKYGAVGDGETLDTEAIQRAVDEAAYTGGTVLLSGGTFFCGEIRLRSDITFFVAPSATLLGTKDHLQYPLREPGKSLCAHRQLGRGLLYGENIKNVTVTGGGMLDGNGLYRYKMNDPAGDKRELDARPDLVYIAYSKNIAVENINFKSSAFWTVVPLSCGNVTLKNLNLDCMNTPNRDGIDPVDCHDITVENCRIMAGDDGLCFKSSDTVGCYNIDVRNMMIQSLASGIKFGTDTYFCLMNARFFDCTVKNVNRCGISLETVDGALVSDVLFERIDMTDVGAPAYVVVGARNRLPRGVDTVRRGRIDGVTFRDIRFENAYPFSYTKDIREIIVCGQSNEQRADNVTFERCRLELCGGFESVPGAPSPIDAKYPEYDRHGLSAGYAFTVRYAKNFAARDCDVVLERPDVRPMTATFDTE